MAGDNSDIALFKALADENRLRILRLLWLEELNVWELVTILGLPQPTISRHLSILRRCGLVKDRRDGTRVFYRVGTLPEAKTCFSDYLEKLSSQEHVDIPRLEACLKRRAAGTRIFADHKAAEWDELAKAFQRQPAQLLMLAGLNPHKPTLADLGTGTGLLLPFLAASASRVYAVDQSSAMLRRARLRCSRNGLDNVRFIHSTLEKMDDQVPPCDGLVLHFVLHQVASPGALLQGLRKFVRQHGRIVIVDRQQHNNQAISEKYGSVWHGFACDQLQQWLNHAGFRTLKWYDLANGDNPGDTPAMFVLIAEPQD